MLLLFKYSLSLLLLVLVYGKRKDKHGGKHKRDIGDLKDDPILTSIFKSDIQEKRNDRSVSPKDEKHEDKDEKLKNELLKTMLSSTKDFQRRDTDNARFNRDLNSSLAIPSSLFATYSDNPIIGNQIPLSSSSKLLGYDSKSPSEGAAVIPQLFQANFMPLDNLEMANPNYQVTKRNSIVHPLIPMQFTPQSMPIQLRKYTQNKRGFVPQRTQYGETVESVEGAQKAMEFKKSMIPDVPYMMNVPAVNPSMYSTDVIKKDDIPEELPGSEGALDESLLKAAEDGVKISDPVSVPANLMATPLAGASNPDQKSTVDAPQVQNLDGAFTRPIIPEADLCSDQYASCTDFAKNNYCSKYPELMKIQCRKSCGFCVAGQKDVIEKVDKTKSAAATDLTRTLDNATDTAAANVTTKPVEAPKNETKATKKSATPLISTVTESVKTVTVEPKKVENVKKAADVAKKSEGTSKKPSSAAKKSADTPKKPSPASPTTNKVESKPELNKKSKEEEKPKEEKNDAEQKSKISDMESGSTNEGDSNEAESGDLGSGDLGSGSGSGSGEEEPAIIKSVIPENNKKSALTATATRASVTKAKSKEEKPKEEKAKDVKSVIKHASKNSKIMGTVGATKSNLGEFTLPVFKSEVSTASLALNDKSESEESGSGSGSGEETEVEEQKIPDSPSSAALPSPSPSKTSTSKKSEAVEHEEKGESKKEKVAKKEEVEAKAKPKAKVPAKKPKETKKHAKSKIVEPKKIVSKATKKSKKPEKAPKRSKPTKVKHSVVSKKSNVPHALKQKTMPYPKIDLRLIASALAHYEEAALELAGEYPKQPESKSTEVSRSVIPKPVAVPSAAPTETKTETASETSRSFIPHPPSSILHPQVEPPLQSSPLPLPETKKELIIDPLDKYRQNLQIAKLLTDDRNGRSTIPKYLKLTKDVHNNAIDEDEKGHADSLTSIQKRFNILGVEPTLIDYYAETGKINPFAAKHKKKEKNVRKSAITNNDPYEYLRNMPAGASMLPIDDPKARSKIPSDHSYPVFLMKVSPGEKKYIDELPMRRGEIRHLNAEGVEIDEKSEGVGLPKDIVNELKDKKQKTKEIEPPLKRTQAPPAPPAAPNPFALPGVSMLQNPFYPNSAQATLAMMSAAENLQKNLLQAQGNIPQARNAAPKPPQLKKPAAPKANVPRPQAKKPVPGKPSATLTDAAAKAMEKSAISIGMQYAQNQMKLAQRNKLNARPRAPPPPNMNRFIQAQRGALNARAQAAQRNRLNAAAMRQQKSIIRQGPPANEVNSLKHKMVSAFFPMKKDGPEGSGESG